MLSGAAVRGVVDLVDVGAGEGELLSAADVGASGLGHPRRVPPRRRRALCGATRRRRRGTCPGATWLSSLEEIPRSSLSGVVVCYELFDALPVRALFFEGEKLLERVVTLGPRGDGGDEARFEWALVECPDGAELLERFRARGIHLLRNQKLEVRPGAADSLRPWPRVFPPVFSSSSTTARPRKRALLGRPPERDARGVPRARRHARRPRGARQPRPDGVGRLFGARGRLHGRRPLRRGAGQPVARPRLRRASSRSSRPMRPALLRPRARSGPPRRRGARPAGRNGRVDPRPDRVPGQRARARAGVVVASRLMPLHRLTSTGSAHRILSVLTEAGRRSGAGGPRGVCS